MYIGGWMDLLTGVTELKRNEGERHAMSVRKGV